MAIILKTNLAVDSDLMGKLYSIYEEQMNKGLMILGQELQFVCETTDTHELEIIEAESIDEAEQITAKEMILTSENRALRERLAHLLQSDFIKSFDEVELSTGEYVRDIKDADKIVPYERIVAVPIEEPRRFFRWR